MALVNEKFGVVKYSRTRQRTPASESNYSSGVLDGHKASINRTVSQNQQKALL